MTKKEKNEKLVDKILKGLDKTYKDLIEYKKRNHEELIILKDDKIVRIKQ
jgi:hypothetical protein